MQQLKLFPMAVLALALLISCGSKTQVAAPPTFTSVPVTAAAEATQYTYQVAATVANGSAVNFKLTSAPTGAVLNGDNIAWTPTVAQSRIADNFTVIATTAAGGSATQSWSVTPSGSIHISWIDTQWGPSGPVDTPIAMPTNHPYPRAAVPQADGSLQILHGSAGANGSFTIPNVPGGHYWLQIGLGIGFWTSASTFDFGRDLVGRGFQPAIGGTTIFSINSSGLNPIQAQDWFAFIMDNGFHTAVPLSFPGSTTSSLTDYVSSNIDFSQVNTIFFMQYQAASPSSLHGLVLGSEATLSNAALSNNTVNYLTETLSATPKAPLVLRIKGSAWADILNNVAPTPVTPVGSVLSVSAQPFVTDRNASALETPLGQNLPLITPDPAGGLLDSQGSSCRDVSSSSIFNGPRPAYQLPILIDQDFGAVQYGDSFPASWPRVFVFCQKVTVPVPIPNSTSTDTFLLQYGQATNLPTSAVAPLISAVQNPTINGASLFVPATLDTTAVTLSWSPPVGMRPYGYYVKEFVLGTSPTTGEPAYEVVGSFGIATTSISVPFLVPGHTFVFLISAEVDGHANMETNPNRSALPTAYANVVSAPITIDSGAVGQMVHGDSSANLNARTGSPGGR